VRGDRRELPGGRGVLLPAHLIMNVRRLAAIDMHGTRGTVRRRRIITAEFIAGTIGAVAFGIWQLCAVASLGGQLFGAWLVGAGLNYAPLAAYAVVLSPPGAIEVELAGIDTGRELRRYGLWQFWAAVPLALVIFAARDVFAGGTSRHGGTRRGTGAR
jgi:hypothetical protein